MWKTLKFYGHLLRTSIIASMSLRMAFLIELAMMVGNNLVYFSLWWIFFKQFNNVGGWELRDMFALMAIGMSAWGMMGICFGGLRYLSRQIVSGDLDPYMTRPKNLLIHLAGAKSLSKCWGYPITSLILIFMGGLTDPATLLLIIIGVLCGALVFTGFNVMAHSLAFWLGPIESVSKRYCDSIYLFVLYPPNIYSGLMQIVMFTIIPAGIIGYLPVELIRHFTWLNLAILISSSLFFFAISFAVFHLGLKRYESGNRIF